MTLTSKVILTVDIGTTSTKAMTVDEQGGIGASCSIPYPLHVPKPGYAEQDPDEMAAAVAQAVRKVMKEAGLRAADLHGISFSSAMHSLIAIDGGGNRLTACITWADQRSIRQADALKASSLGLAIYRRTGTPIHPMSPLCKLMWMKEQDKEVFGQAEMFVGIKEYILYSWFGRYVMDYSIAGATGLFNIETLNWDEGALAAAGVKPSQLPELVPTTAVLSGMRDSARQLLGLDADVPVVIGSSDGVLANLGVGIVSSEAAAVTIGTSGAVRTTLSRPLTHPAGDLFCYCLTEQHWVIGGAVNNGGIALQWIRELLYDHVREEMSDRDVLTAMNEWAASVAPGSEGLLCLPLFTGERAPYYNANARGAFVGLTLSHKQRHMVRAVMEGVMYQIASVVRSMEQLSGDIEELWASGGFANSLLWRQMMADITGVATRVPDDIESSGLGAAKLALYALGVTGSIDPGWKKGGGSLYNVNEQHHGVYERILPIYRRTYEALKASFDEISEFQKS